MSALDTIIDNNVQGPSNELLKQAIKDLFLELIGDSNNKGNFTDMNGTRSNLISDVELRQKVESL